MKGKDRRARKKKEEKRKQSGFHAKSFGTAAATPSIGELANLYIYLYLLYLTARLRLKDDLEPRKSFGLQSRVRPSGSLLKIPRVSLSPICSYSLPEETSHLYLD